ncbi:MAG: hypothetical protein NTV73_07665 [Hyphomicrobiales bacterium]|nr:hypothetical protein [Hyphomicrobiales bacterium]
MKASRENTTDATPKREWLDEKFQGVGRGIVICAGGVRMFTNAWVLVWQLRKTLGCKLPIEVWHLGAGEMSNGMQCMMEGLGAKVVDAHKVLSRFPARIIDGWQLKPYALIMSGFREVLMLDADNVPTVDPAFLFDRPEFADTGAVFWPDMLDLSQDNPIWRELDLPARQCASLETGQLLVDKDRHRVALQAVLRLNEDAERYYRLVYGDKDTFLVAWLLADAPYLLVPFRPIADRHVLYQHDFDGRIVFQHRTNGKWNYGREQARSDAFFNGEACETALAELRRIWNGRIFEPPARSPAAVRMEQSMQGRMFIAARPGHEDRRIELLAHCQIGEGRGFEHENWHVVEPDPGSFVLRILDRHRTTLELVRHDDDHWTQAAPSEDAVSFTALWAADEIASDRQDDFAFARALTEAALRGAGWTPEAAEELQVTLRVLSRIDTRLAREIAGYAAAAQELDEGAREGLQRVAAEQERLTAEGPQRRDMRSDTNLLFDGKHYVRP